MASDLQIQGEVVVNSEKAESAFDRVGDKAQQMANEVSTSAGRAGQAVDKIGDGAGASADKFTRAESRMSAAIKKATNELELLGKTASQRLEFNIADKGLDASKFEPALQKLREVEAQALQAQRVATGSLDKMGISAAQTAAALRGVPAQFTDIVTSLQGGQAPLTVLLQQGGQLKDMFGGVGNAARALGGYVLGLVNPFTVAAAAVAAVGVAYNQGSKEADEYNKAIITTGNAAGVNAAQLKSYALEISGVVGTQGKAAESLAALASTGKVGAESLRDAARAAIEYERATGQAVGKTAEQFASLRNDPLTAVLKLNDGMNFLTDSTYKQIKSLEEQGKTAEAANIAQRAFAETLSARAGEMERNLGTVERGWLRVKDAAKGAWDAILNVGRASTSVDQLAEVRKKIAERENQIANGGFASNEGGAAFGRPSQANTERLRAELSALQAQAAALEGVAFASRTAAEEERKRGEAVKATAEFDQAGGKYLTDKAKMERELAAARVQGAEAGKTQAEIEQRLAQIRESYAKKSNGGGSGADREANRELERQAKLLAELSGLSGSFAQDWESLNNAFAAGKLSVEQLTQAQAKLIEKQPFAIAQAKQQADATKAQAKAAEEGARAHAKYIEELSRGAVAVEQQVDKMRLEQEAAAIASQGYYSLAEAIELVTIARLKEKRDGLLGNEDAYLAVQKEIEAREKLLGVIRTTEARKASEEAAKQAQADWQRTAESIERSLTDSLLRGFESGKDFAKNFRDTLINMFKTLVLRPIISFIVNPISMAISGAVNSGLSALGLGGNLLGGGGSSVLGALGTAGSSVAGLIGSGVGSIFGGTAGNAAIGGALGLGTGSSAAAAAGASVAAGGTGAGAGLGAAIGANAIPIVGGIMLAIGALKRLTSGETRVGGQFGVAYDGEVRNYRRGETYTYQGQQYDRDFSNGRRDALVNGQAYRLEGDPLENEQAIRDAVAGTASGIGAMLKALGSSVTVTGFSAGLETSGKGRGGVFAGGRLSNGATFGESGEGDNYAGTLYEKFSSNSPDFKQALADFSLDLKQSTIQALQSVSDIPDSIKKQIEDIDAEALTEEAADALLTAINAQIVGVERFRTALGAMGLTEFADMAFDTAAAIAEAAGGFEELQASLNSYYENYYSEAEKTALKTKLVRDALAEVGLEMPRTREEFRAMVEAALAMGEAGAEIVAVLLSVGDEFADVTPKVLTLADAFNVTGDMIKGILDDAIKNASSAAEASEMASQAFVEGMYSSINDALTSNLSGLILGAIQPMVDALIAGATTGGAAMAAGGAAGGGAVAAGGAAGGGAVAAGGAAGGGAVAAGGAAASAVMTSVIESARIQIGAWAAILADPEIQAMIGDIGELVGGVAGVAFDAQSSWGGGGGGGSGFQSPGSSGVGNKGMEYENALKGIGDTIEEEVKRLRGLMVEESPFSRESLIAQFTTATAQARAGDKTALEKLPELSKAIEAASDVTAVSSVEMARTRGWLAGSLEETLKALGLTGPGGVTPVITAPTSTPATPTPQVVQPIYNPAISGATMDPALLAAVKDLSQKLTSLMANDDQNHEEAQSMRLRLARSMERLESATVLQS